MSDAMWNRFGTLREYNRLTERETEVSQRRAVKHGRTTATIDFKPLFQNGFPA